ncbi:MAG: signal peptidase I [Candidatus Bathycorpusculaceae bacterium]
MALETLKKLWKNEYFQTAITLILLIAFVFGFWYITQTALRTEYPALAVASQSMLPTLNVGDLIIVQGVSPEQVNASYSTGDIVVFKDAQGDLFVHRAVKIEKIGEDYWFTTKGDNVPGDKDQFSPWPSSRLVGRVVGRIPWIGNFALLLHSPQNVYFFTVIIIVLIVIFLFFPFETGEEKKEGEERLIFGKISLKMVSLIILNIFLICFIIFSLWGTFTFWNPGAGSNSHGMYVTIYGMFSDVNFHNTYSLEAFLSQGFLTYTINCQLSGGLQTGVPTFSWSQAAIIILIVLDAWNLVKILRKQGKLKLKRGRESTIL